MKGSGGGGKLVLVLAWNDQFQKPEGVEVSQTGAVRTGVELVLPRRPLICRRKV